MHVNSAKPRHWVDLSCGLRELVAALEAVERVTVVAKRGCRPGYEPAGFTDYAFRRSQTCRGERLDDTPRPHA